MSEKLTEASKEEAKDTTDSRGEEQTSVSSSASARDQTGSKKAAEQKGEKKSSTMDKVREMMANALHLGGAAEDDVPKILDEVSFQAIVRYIQSGKCKNIVTMVGAGISTAAGIPDFRSPGSGLYDNLQEYDLPDPQAIFSLDFFMENPKPFFVLTKELFPGSLKPTLSHYFIRMLNDKDLLLRHYTQNIDTLERLAGLPQDKLVEAHGTFHTSHCLKCQAMYTLPWLKEKIFADEIPRCTHEDCTGVVKPDIVFFGERLPVRFATCVMQDLQNCDLLIVMGTSLVVQPFASLVNRVPAATPRLYINLEKTSAEADLFSLLMGGGGGFRFDAEDNYRDVFQESTCDDGCTALAEKLGWGEELRTLMKTEHERMDKEKASEGGKPKPEGGASVL